MNRKTLTILTLALTAIFLTSPVPAADAPALVHGSSSGLSFEAQVANAGSVLTVSGPGGIHFQESYAAGEQAFFSIFDALGVLPDGSYTYSLTMTPKSDSATRELMNEARATGDDSLVYSLKAEGKIPAEAQALSGSFTIAAGAIVSDALVEEEGGFQAQSGNASTGGGLTNVNAAAQVFTTDLVVQGSGCIGFDCVSSESFGSDTLRLKENNLRIHFDDTSSSASFPGNDWRITANDSSNGGAEYLAFEDATAGNQPFLVEAGAGANAMRIDDAGNIGIGTASPVVEIHLTDGDSPTLRLEQDGASGFTPQTWDIAGNETNFFIRDVTNSSALPFRILSGSGTNNALVITADGDIGIGKATANFKLDVAGSIGISGDSFGAAVDIQSNRAGSDARLLVEEQMPLPVAIMAHLKSNGTGQLVMEDVAGGGIWRQRYSGSTFTMEFQGGVGANELTINGTNGNMTILGDMNATGFNMTSDRNAKTNIVEVNPEEVLKKVAALPVSTWSYKQDAEGVQHIGPMAQDFHAAFGLGPNDTKITVGDTSGVALAAIKALYRSLQEKQGQLNTVLEQNALLIQRLEALEAKVQ